LTGTSAVHPFRLSVLGAMVCRKQLARVELQPLIREASAHGSTPIPGTQRRHIGEKTIEAWYAWRREGIAGLAPKARVDRGRSRISAPIQEAVLATTASRQARKPAPLGAPDRAPARSRRHRREREPVTLGPKKSAASPPSSPARYPPTAGSRFVAGDRTGRPWVTLIALRGVH